jgi:uncharacterized protein (DUF1810 family)
MLASGKGASTMAHDPFNLERFISAQATAYQAARQELQRGRKQTHWMWFIFPQIEGLGQSPTSKLYSIKSQQEARQYLSHRLLGARLVECANILLELEGRSAHAIFGSPDDLKLKSSMTLFAQLEGQDSVFAKVLDMYFQGERDTRTVALLHQQGSRKEDNDA